MAELNINELKGSAPAVQAESVPVQIQKGEFTDPNLLNENTTENEISASDLGLPKKALPPTENSLNTSLNLIDKAVDRKIDEVRRFNDAMDERGGEITEFEWRALNGEAPLSVMTEGIDPEIAESGDVDALLRSKGLPPVSNETEKAEANTETEKASASSELEELEKEADCEDYAATEKAEEAPISIEQRREPDNETTQSTDVEKVMSGEVTSISDSDIASGSEDDIDKDIENLINNTTPSSENEDDFNTKLRNAVKKKMTNNIVPISSFKIVNDRPISTSNIMEARTKHNHSNVLFKWVLYHSGTSFTMRAFNSDELDTIMTNVRNGHNPKMVFKTMYDHIVDGKNDDFITWAKRINRLDISNLWFGVYGSCFQFSNYVPYECDKCKEVMLSDKVPVQNMVKFKNEEIERKFKAIYETNPSDPQFDVMSTRAIVPISEDIAVATKLSSIYSAIIEPEMFDAEFKKKYGDIIRLIQFIDNIYYIDKETNALRPVAVKKDPTNEIKSLKLKILVWAKIIKSFTSDEKGALIDIINTLNQNDTDNIQYCTPASICDKCGSPIEEAAMGAADLVFIRHQLTLFGTM